MAAGSSTRYQGIKLLDLIDGRKMYLPILEIMQKLSCTPKIIVTQYDEILEAAPRYGFLPVRNEEPELGISLSLQLGLLKALEQDPMMEGVLFGVCDQPYLRPASIERLIEGFLHSEKNIAALSCEGIVGNPCIFGKTYYEELLALTGDVGGKKIIMVNLPDVLLVPAEDAKELVDIDTRQM